MKKTGCSLLTAFLFFIITDSYVIAQEAGQGGKIKSIVVYIEKHDALVTRKYKDLEQNFDPQGNLLEEITYKQGKISNHIKYYYDRENNKIKEEKYSPTGHLTESSEYKYENGLRIEKIVYDSDRKVRSRKIYQYTSF
ncbi:MAG: hypothetical protein WCE64_11500 [Bacteroidales bacterium]